VPESTYGKVTRQPSTPGTWQLQCPIRFRGPFSSFDKDFHKERNMKAVKKACEYGFTVVSGGPWIGGSGLSVVSGRACGAAAAQRLTHSTVRLQCIFLVGFDIS
jgi:hypothetical protein